MWLRAFVPVVSSKDVTPTNDSHGRRSLYGDLIRRLGPTIVHYTEGMEHKHKPIKRDEGGGGTKYNSEYCNPYSIAIMQCSRRLLAKQWVHVNIHGGEQ